MNASLFWTLIVGALGMLLALLLKWNAIKAISIPLRILFIVGLLIACSVLGQYIGYIVVIDTVGSLQMKDFTRLSGLTRESEIIVYIVQGFCVFLVAFLFLHLRKKNAPLHAIP